jgi:hypothetical protein
MVADLEWFSPTRAVGLTAYTASLLACASRWARYRKRDFFHRLYGVLAGVQLFLLLDMAFDWRWKLHDMGARLATELGVYGERRMPQTLALMVLSLALVLVFAWVFCRFRRRIGVALMLAGTLFSLGLWCLECVSLHAVDAVLYRMVGAVMRVSLVWICVAFVTCWGAWLDGSDGSDRSD